MSSTVLTNSLLEMWAIAFTASVLSSCVVFVVMYRVMQEALVKQERMWRATLDPLMNRVTRLQRAFDYLCAQVKAEYTEAVRIAEEIAEGKRQGEGD